MSRHVELERILQAWFDLESGLPSQKDRLRRVFDELLDGARTRSGVSRQELIVALSERYREFRTAKEKEIKARLSRLR